MGMPCPLLEKNSISQVIESNPRLTQANKVNTFAARIARDDVYGENLMKKCTALGGRELPGLPRNELFKIKKTIFDLLPT